MGSFSTIPGAGVTKLSELTIDTQGYFKTDIATVATAVNATDTADAALYFDALDAGYIARVCNNSNLTVAKAASIMDNSNLTATKVASICDSANITSAKIKAILDTGSLTVADKIAALLDGDSLTAADAATHVNSGTYTDALMASAFDSSYLAAAKLQSILDNTNLTIQKGQEIVDAMSSPSKIGTGGRRGVIGDDWDDNKLTSRDNAATVATALDKIVQTFRPEWTVKAGTITVANSRVEGDASGTNEVQTSSLSITEGTWEVDIIVLATGHTQLIYFIYQDIDNHYHAGNSTPGGTRAWYLYKYEGGAGSELILSSWTEATGTYALKVTRDSSGNFELFVDGNSKGTATDTWLPTTYDSIVLRVTDDNSSAMDNLKVY